MEVARRRNEHGTKSGPLTVAALSPLGRGRGRAGGDGVPSTRRSARCGLSRRSPEQSSGTFESFGPPPLGRDLEVSTFVLDRNGKLLRAYLTSEGRWRLPATRQQVDPIFLEALLAYEDKRFYYHRGVDPLAVMRAAYQFVDAGPHRLGRLDHHHAGRAPAGAARHRSARRQAARRRCARFELEWALSKDEILGALSDARALWRQSRRHPRGLARLFRQGAAAAHARRGGVARGAAAIAGIPPARSLPEAAQARARPRARPHRRQGTVQRRRDRARQARGRADGAQECRSSRRMPPTRRWRKRRKSAWCG